MRFLPFYLSVVLFTAPISLASTISVYCDQWGLSGDKCPDETYTDIGST